MQRNKFDFKKFITPFDFIIVAVIIVGLAIAVFFTQEIAVQLIGVAITVLAVVFLIINISQRMSEIVDTRYKPANPPPNFTITVKQDGKAKRQVIEDFDSSYGEVESKRGFKNKSNPQVFDISSAEEGFRVVSVSSEKNTSDESSSKRDFVKSEPRKIDNKEDSIMPSFAGIKEEIKQDLSLKPLFASAASKIRLEIKADFSKKHKEVVPEENSNNIEEVNELDSKQNELKVLRFDDLEDEIETLEEAKSEIPVIADNEIVIENDNVINEIVIENVNVINEVVIDDIEQKISNPESLDDALDEFITFSNEINSANENWVDLEEYHSDSLEIYEEPVSLELSTELVQEQLEHVEIMENDIQTDMLDIEVKQIAVFDEEMTPPEVQISAEISKGYTEKFIDYPLSALMEEVPNLSDEPRKEFDYMISRVLMAIRAVSNTKTAALILVNNEKRELLLEAYVTENEDSIYEKQRIKIGNDIVSQIVNNIKPEILSEINPSAEMDLIPYYKKSTGVASFVGLPVYYGDSLVGVLCADSSDPDAYDAIMVGFMGHFTKIISGLLKSYTERYDLIQDSKAFKAINLFNNISANANLSYYDINSALIETVSRIVECNTLGIIAYDENNEGWHINMLSSTEDENEVLLGKAVLLESSIIGETILKSESKMIVNIQDSKVRVHTDENEMKGGFFISIPLKSSTSTFGALFLEGKKSSSVSEVELKMLETIVENAGNVIEKIHLLNLLQDSTLIDPITQVMNFPAFYHRTNEEIDRSCEFDTTSCLCLIEIDKYSSFDPIEFQERLNKVMLTLIKLINGNVKSYDIVGQIDNTRLGVLLIGFELNKAKLWAEKLRNQIAITLVEIDNRKFNMTACFGIVEINRKETIENYLSSANTALSVSLSKTNTVSIYS
jgi:diguanylate cyclase (GGDEF)-like protein